MKEIESKECNDVLAECNNIPFNQTFVPPFYDYLQDFTVSSARPQLNLSPFRFLLVMIYLFVLFQKLCLQSELPQYVTYKIRRLSPKTTEQYQRKCMVEGKFERCWFSAVTAGSQLKLNELNENLINCRFCENNELKSFKMVQRSLNSNFDNIIFTRNPYDRFISGFTEKCVK